MASNMNTPFESRKVARFNDEVPVLIEVGSNGEPYHATMYNFSGDGMYCVSSHAIEIGTKISVLFERQFSNSTPKKYFGVVNRCVGLKKDTGEQFYGLGIRIFETVKLTT